MLRLTAMKNEPDVDLGKAFDSNGKFRWDEYEATLSRHQHHPLVLPSGKIMVGDPVWFDQHPEPLEHPVPPGTYPVDVAFRVARQIDDEPDAAPFEDIALVRITFSQKPVARWISATARSQPTGLPICSRYDVVCYTDAATIRQHLQAKTLHAFVGDAISKDGTYTQIVVDPKTGANIVEVPAGSCACLDYPGRQGVYWGLDQDGAPVCLITDFGALSQASEDGYKPLI